ncbi:MAG: hypothetical protein R3D89_08770 [Sphingomonadaceae bacterium]
MTKRITIQSALAASAALLLAACGSEDATTYEADAVDESGGELIVEDADAPGVDVNLPETEMTNVPAEGEAAEAPAAEDAPAE